MKLPDGSYSNDQSEILQEQMHFYKTLYTSGKKRYSIFNDAHRICKENIIPLENVDKLLCEKRKTARYRWVSRRILQAFLEGAACRYVAQF